MGLFKALLYKAGGWLATDWLKAVSQFFFNPLQDIFIMRF